MPGQAALAGQAMDLPDDLQRIDVAATAVMGILQANQAGRGVVHVLAATNHPRHLGGRDYAAYAVEQSDLHAGDGGEAVAPGNP